MKLNSACSAISVSFRKRPSSLRGYRSPQTGLGRQELYQSLTQVWRWIHAVRFTGIRWPRSLNRKGIRRPSSWWWSQISIEGIDSAFLKVIDTHTAGSPRDAQVKWMHLTRRKISQLLKDEGIGHKKRSSSVSFIKKGTFTPSQVLWKCSTTIGLL